MDRWDGRRRRRPGLARRDPCDHVLAGPSRQYGSWIRGDTGQYVRRGAGRPGCDPCLCGAGRRAAAGSAHLGKAEGAMNVGLNLVLAASAALFAVGAFAVVARRSAVLMLIGTQFMFMAGSIAFVAFARFGLGAVNATAGAAVAIFAGATAVAELAVGLAMAALIYREHRSLAVDADRG